MAFGLDDILWIIAGGTYVASRSAEETIGSLDDHTKLTYSNLMEGFANKMLSLFYNSSAEKKFSDVLTYKRRHDDPNEVWIALETFKQRNPVWCMLHGSLGENEIRDKKSLYWLKVGEKRFSDYNCDDALDLLLQTEGKHSLRKLNSLAQKWYNCEWDQYKGVYRLIYGVEIPKRVFVPRQLVYDPSNNRRTLPNPWRAVAPRELVDFLSSSVGVDHDAAVYDTGYEFDPQDEDAVRFVAWKAMEKAVQIWFPIEIHGVDDAEFLPSFACEMPQNGSVAPAYDEMTNPKLLELAQKRLFREKQAMASRGVMYIPESRYAELVVNACHRHNICKDDLTPKERFARGVIDKLHSVKRAAMWVLRHSITIAIVIGALMLLPIMVIDTNTLYNVLGDGSKHFAFTALSLVVYGIACKLFLRKTGISVAIFILYTFVLWFWSSR